MKKIKYLYSLVYLLVLFAITSCAPSIYIKSRADNRVDVEVSIKAGKALKNLLDTYGIPFNDSETLSKIKEGMKDNTFYNVKANATGDDSFKVLGTVLPVSTQKVLLRKERQLILNLSPQEMQNFAKSLPEEFQEYLAMLAAPVFTGEPMSKEEYISLISVFYGQDLAEDLKKANLNITLESPEGKKKTFKLPLVEFFTLTEEKTFTIEY
ncbi:MAG: hypothetical protein K6G00_10630 [Treponema sp.]|nr:hypothetical protein [Treponema sp.]